MTLKRFAARIPATVLAAVIASGAVAPSSAAKTLAKKGTLAVDKKQKSVYHKLAKVSLSEAIQAATTHLSGTPVEAQLEREDGFLIYSVKIAQADSSIMQVYVDAGDKGILGQEPDVPEVIEKD